MTTTSRHPASSQSTSPTNFETRHTSFAEAARDTEFRGRDLRLAREPGFIDRPPYRPRRLGEVVDQVAAETGEKAVRHWRKKAALALSLRERDEALSIARKIALKAGLEFPEDRKRAA